MPMHGSPKAMLPERKEQISFPWHLFFRTCHQLHLHKDISLIAFPLLLSYNCLDVLGADLGGIHFIRVHGIFSVLALGIVLPAVISRVDVEEVVPGTAEDCKVALAKDVFWIIAK